MLAYIRSGMMLAVALCVGIGLASLPTRAGDDGKTLKHRVKKLQKRVANLEAKLAHMSVEEGPINGLTGPHVIFEGCNVHVRSGSGDSTDGTFDLQAQTPIAGVEPLGLGNLVVGYNETPLVRDLERSGSHNLVVGPGHVYPNVAGAAFGQENQLLGPLASATGGSYNTASGPRSSVSGGQSNEASHHDSSVSGGRSNLASDVYSSVSGGYDNAASNDHASVSGGHSNVASGSYSCVSGGFARTADGVYDWVGGGLFESD